MTLDQLSCSWLFKQTFKLLCRESSSEHLRLMTIEWKILKRIIEFCMGWSDSGIRIITPYYLLIKKYFIHILEELGVQPSRNIISKHIPLNRLERIIPNKSPSENFLGSVKYYPIKQTSTHLIYVLSLIHIQMCIRDRN